MLDVYMRWLLGICCACMQENWSLKKIYMTASDLINALNRSNNRACSCAHISKLPSDIGTLAPPGQIFVKLKFPASIATFLSHKQK